MMRGRSLNINEGGIGGVLLPVGRLGLLSVYRSRCQLQQTQCASERSYAIAQATAMDLSSWI